MLAYKRTRVGSNVWIRDVISASSRMDPMKEPLSTIFFCLSFVKTIQGCTGHSLL